MEKRRINGERMGRPSFRWAADARDLAQSTVDEGKAWVSRKAIPCMIGTLVIGLVLGFSFRLWKEPR